MDRHLPSEIKITEFSYELPADRIAKFPLAERDKSKLLVYKNKSISQDIFKNVVDHLPEDALLVLNDTKVIQARLHFKTEQDQPIEIFCLEPSSSTISEGLSKSEFVTWNCLVGNLRRWKNGALIISHNTTSLKAEIEEKNEGFVKIKFTWTPSEFSFAEILEDFGNIPIPPYLERNAEIGDKKNYQTVYSEKEGSVAAPTAGLHFTENVMQNLVRKCIETLRITLHVGAGTFKPVEAETLQGHEMHAEWLDLDVEAISKISVTHQKKIFAVGTTSLRTIESLYWMGVKASKNIDCTLSEIEINQWEVYELNSTFTIKESFQSLILWMQKKELSRLVCKTRILIAPPYKLRVAGGLITNFHQPQSTLLLLVSAVTDNNWRSIYDYAMENDFRFLSYGDSSLLFGE